METTKSERQWERTNFTKVLRNRQSGKYYVYAKADGKQKSRTLKTEVFSAAKPAPTKLEKGWGRRPR
jgi:hypothetical protein